jgi:threonylcarbamoyladenosine tRNA methylthiotransferase MtaB
MKVALFTIGCKVNQYETEVIAEKLESFGFERVDFSQPADIYIINTCTVTKESDYSSRQAIYRAKRRSPDANIVVTGCYAQTDKEFLQGLPGVSLVIKQAEKLKLPSRVIEMLGQGARVKEKETGKEDDTFGSGVKGLSKHTRALVKIQDGCEKNCAYCIVPFARGKEISREVDQIIAEINALVGNGYKEIVLTGVHAGRYNGDGMNLVGLSQEILKQTKVERIRYSSIEPKEISEELINFISHSNRVCRHLHIPLQSGDDSILSEMQRDYTAEEYLNIAKRISQATPSVLIGADVIVGFPGEIDQQFEDTCRFILSSPVNYLHVFSYSDRKGTAASQMLGKVPPEVIHKRSEILHDLGREKWQSFIDRFVGQRLNVLIENRRDRKTGLLTGLSDNYIRVLLDGDDSLKNTITSVQISQRKDNILLGTL